MKAERAARATGKPSPTPKLDALLQAEPDLVDRIFDYVVDLVPQLATQRDEIKTAIRQEFAGARIYVTKRSSDEQARLGQQVLAMFNGRNATEVARKLNIHRATVYRFLKQPGGR